MRQTEERDCKIREKMGSSLIKKIYDILYYQEDTVPAVSETLEVESLADIEKFDRERKLVGWQNITFTVIAIGMAWYHIYYMTYGFISTIALRSGHLMFAMLGAFLFFPLSPRRSNSNKATWDDLMLAGLGIMTGFYIILTYHSLVWRFGDLENRDIIMGIILILLTLEMTRRVMGLALPIVASSAIAYGLLGHKIPGLFGHGGIGVERLVGQLYCTLEGIYGVAIGVMVSFIYFFILFGAFLIKTGATKFFIDLAFSITGRSVGGPAKAAVLASGTMSMINGSAQANVVTTGCLTIPTMKKIGYPPHTAAAVETAASAGGIFTPPIMGAGAFIMADWLGIPYFDVVKVAAIPAGLYFFSLLLFVHSAALKLNIGRMRHTYRLTVKKLLRQGSPFFASIAVLIYLLVRGYSPQYAAIAGLLALVVVGMIFKETRLSPKEFVAALVLGAKNTILASAACACAGIVIGVVGLTGLGLKFSTIVLSLSGGNLFWAIILVLLASLVLGMGLTVTPAYLTLAILAAPALMQLGLNPLVAHMIIFWFSQDSQVTPPVCVTAYTAAAVARSDPFKTGLSAWALAKGLYIIPIFMAYGHIIEGTAGELILSTLICAACLFAFNGFMHGYIFCKLNYIERLNFGIAAALFMISDYRSWIVAAILLVAGIAIQKVKSLKKSAPNDNLTETFEKQQI